MSLDRRLPAKAHMGALVVIKVDNSLQESHTVSSGCNLHFVPENSVSSTFLMEKTVFRGLKITQKQCYEH